MSVDDNTHELLLQGKSDMLDEVNQLLDLMVTEKQTLQQRIANLEAELETVSSGQVAKDHGNTKLIQDDKTSSQTQKPVEPDFKQLQSAINQEQKNIQQLYQRVQDIEQYCKMERETHQATLNQSQLHLTQVQNSLKKQCRENKKLQEEILSSHRNYQELESSHKNMLNTLEEMKGRYTRTRTSLLAVKGRTALEQKRILKEEEQLVRKQRELDEVVVREKELKIKLQQTIELRGEDKTKLNNKIIKKDKEIVQLVKQLKIVKESVAEQLFQIEAELQSSRKELNELQQLLTTQQLELDKTKKCLQEERRRTEKLLTQNQVTINRLISQLERERLDYQKEVQALNVAMETQKQEAALQLERLKDVSMRRCTELAQEVWSLKLKQPHD